MYAEVLTYLKNLLNINSSIDDSNINKQKILQFAIRILLFMFIYSLTLAIEEILLGYFILNKTFGTKYLILLTSGLNLLVDLIWLQKENYVNNGSDFLIAEQNNILINKLINTDFGELDAMDKLRLSANLAMLRIIYETLTTYIEYIVSFIVCLSVAIIYNFFIGNYYVVFSLIIFIFTVWGSYLYSYKGLDYKFKISDDASNQLTAKTSELCQDLFNISINKDDKNINNYKLEYTKTNSLNASYMHSKSLSDTMFVSLVGIGFYIIHFFNPNININIIVGLIGIFRSLYQILYNSADLQNKLNIIIPNVKYINQLYKLEPRPTTKQIKLRSNDKILIQCLNINKPYLNLQLTNPIELEANNLYWISGKSGCGKSTLVKIIRGIIDLDSPNENVKINILRQITDSSVEISSEKIANKELANKELANKELDSFLNISSNIYYVGQNNKLYRCANIYDLISGSEIKNISKEDITHIDMLLKISDIEYLNKPQIINPHNLSGGELLRVSLCKTLFQCKKRKLKIIIMDEIDAGLDTNISRKIYNYIKNNFKKSIILIVSHKDILNKLNLPKITIADGKITFYKPNQSKSI
jgi:ABC-type lipoprotein export system ATPase subunit